MSVNNNPFFGYKQATFGGSAQKAGQQGAKAHKPSDAGASQATFAATAAQRSQPTFGVQQTSGIQAAGGHQKVGGGDALTKFQGDMARFKGNVGQPAMPYTATKSWNA